MMVDLEKAAPEKKKYRCKYCGDFLQYDVFCCDRCYRDFESDGFGMEDDYEEAEYDD